MTKAIILVALALYDFLFIKYFLTVVLKKDSKNLILKAFIIPIFLWILVGILWSVLFVEEIVPKESSIFIGLVMFLHFLSMPTLYLKFSQNIPLVDEKLDKYNRLGDRYDIAKQLTLVVFFFVVFAQIMIIATR